MPIVTTMHTPFTIHRTNSILNGIEHIVKYRIDLTIRHIIATAELTAYPNVHHIQSSGMKIFTKLQVFVIAKPIGAPITPGTKRRPPLFNFPNTVFPVGRVGNAYSFNKTTTGPTYKCGMQPGNILGKIIT